MTRAKRTTLLAVFFSMALLVGLEASARTERLRWSHPDPAAVDGYRVHYGTQSQVYTSEIDVETPATDSEGAFFYDLYVEDDAATIYVAVTAYAGDLESLPSNEGVRAPSEDPGTSVPLGRPGRPTLVLD